ncbi:MAG: hypothetical protein A2Z27_02170 [candidate division Zixibacteria bacterium RBG_16_50_21]|nr:MAG: hypothetical protein A2Z27_02170 [candidate division Zixibacteria bacterium RBG_16_50_21]
MKRYIKDTVIGVTFTIVGGILGYWTSTHFYEVSEKDERKKLIEGALIELGANSYPGNYPELFDSTAYLSDTGVWRKLLTSGMVRLYFSIFEFKEFPNFEEFVSLVNEVKILVDDFNERITIRNHTIFKGFEYMRPHNPRAYHYYQTVVLPKLKNLLNYLMVNRPILVGK